MTRQVIIQDYPKSFVIEKYSKLFESGSITIFYNSLMSGYMRSFHDWIRLHLPVKKLLLFSAMLFPLLLLSCSKEEDQPIVITGPLKDVKFWAYQLEGLDRPSAIDSICNSHYDLIVMDQERSIIGDEDYDNSSDVSKIKASKNSSGKGKLVLSYIDVGQAESYRYYWKAEWDLAHPSWMMEKDPDGWNDNYGVKFWAPEWKAIMKSYIDRIIEDGFDGIYMDWLMIYEEQSIIDAAKNEGLESGPALVSFIKELADYAHSKKSDFLFIAQNAPELGQYEEYRNIIDGIAQEDIWYDGSGDPDNGGSQGDVEMDASESEYVIEQLNVWLQNNKPVLNVEYASQPAKVSRAYTLGGQNHFVTYTTLRLLDKLTQTPPPGY
ncbi:MAG: endo alpha-1,4 polygalactosaminidase [Bacteroidales bacterium]|nr:endo alpha-1,4 polygalactosaminidase [Bacteroidales bacterium]